MTAPDVRLTTTVQAVGLDRRKGDAFSGRRRFDEARQQYERALDRLDRTLDRGDEIRLTPSDRSELQGMRGGILRRLGRLDEALESYRAGAAVERDAHLPGTYNRSNAIKLALISGASTLASVEPELTDLRVSIEARMRADVQAASDAWNYADLGDTLLLTGRVVEATDAYRRFSERARSDSPTTTLAVLREITTALQDHGDPDGPRLADDVARVERMLTGH